MRHRTHFRRQWPIHVLYSQRNALIASKNLFPCDLDQNTRNKDASAGQFGHFGLWLSLVERLVRDQEAVGSNPTSPILTNSCRRADRPSLQIPLTGFDAANVAVLISSTGVWHKRL